jgi:hypothetical protein
MTERLLTPAEVLAIFRRKDRHWPRAAARRGLIEAVNVGGSGNGARYLYRLKNLEPEAPAVNEEEAHYLELERRHRW